MRRFDYLILAFMAATLVAATSDWVISGNVTYADTFYDDLSIGSEREQTGAGSPSYAQIVGGLYGYFLQIGDGTRFTLQTPHKMKAGTALEAHVHIAPDGADANGGNARFTLDCSCADINETFTALSTITSVDCAMGATADKHVYCDLGDVTGADGLSFGCGCSFQRVAAASDEYVGSVAIVFNDFHFQIDSPGSRQEGTK